MEKYGKILFILNQKEIKSQRELAQGLDISLGQINYLLKEMTQQEYLRKGEVFYQMTEKGEALLEAFMKSKQEAKMEISSAQKKIRKAVILAAGENLNFDRPEGLLEIDGIPLIEHLISQLTRQGIVQIVFVTGSRKEAYERYFEGRSILLVQNPRYRWTGTMASLYAARDYLTEDFLIVEGNQVLEAAGIEKIMNSEYSNSMLLVSPSDSSDAAYVELDDNGCIFRISKDRKQMNRIDAELTGVSKISLPLFQKMLKYYEKNENPFLNYEYAIESIGRMYHIYGVRADDLLWSVVENENMYRQAADILYPRIKKKYMQKEEDTARKILISALGVSEDEIGQIRIGGGMTNHNYCVKLKEKDYILRIPGACTDRMINRIAEKNNSVQASLMGVNPAILYFDENTGIKITEYISGAKTLNPGSARLEGNMQSTADILKRLHCSQIHMEGSFDPWGEYEKYKGIVLEKGGVFYQGFSELEEFFYHLKEELEKAGRDYKPCHNDLVAENFVCDEKGKMYLIDWEYSGINDPMWDLASHLIECKFTPSETELYLQYYFDREADTLEKQKILLFQICQDVLWSVWTIMKETEGEKFGTYGNERYERAVSLKKEYEEAYEKNR